MILLESKKAPADWHQLACVNQHSKCLSKQHKQKHSQGIFSCLLHIWLSTPTSRLRFNIFSHVLPFIQNLLVNARRIVLTVFKRRFQVLLCYMAYSKHAILPVTVLPTQPSMLIVPLSACASYLPSCTTIQSSTAYSYPLDVGCPWNSTLSKPHTQPNWHY